MDYLQPDFYHFNEDSLKLINFVATQFTEIENILDIGTGCGVIGIELAQKIKINTLDLLEVQPDFEPYILENLNTFIPNQKNNVFINSISLFKVSKKYDLIVCNPPYYLPGSGQVSRDSRRGICRSFQIDSWKELLGLFSSSLRLSGSAWVVIKNDKTIRIMVEQELAKTNLKLSSYSEDDVLFLKFYLEV